MLGLCIPERYGGMGASFQDYMHVAAELARFCPMTALTYNMHSQTTLWTGILADDLDMAPDARARHERIRSALYRWILEDGAIMSQPLSEGIARGATAGVATPATPVPGGFHVRGRKVFALWNPVTCVYAGSLFGAAGALGQIGGALCRRRV
jgi:alkylation response protein AidB-like acyl-CoA dehydrogenase